MKKILALLLPLLFPIITLAHEGDTLEEFSFNTRAFWAQPTFTHKVVYFSEFYIIPNIATITLVGAFIVLALVIGIRFMKKNNPKKIVMSGTTWVGIYLISVLIGYSTIIYFQQQADKGIVVCKNAEECTIAMHIHAELHVHPCAAPITFPREVGDLSSAHTHKEKNLIHWHDTTSYDLQEEKIIDTSELTLNEFFNQMEKPFDGKCFDGLCNGDLCNEKEGEWKMWVNQKSNTEMQNYVWKDGDVIHLFFQDKENNETPPFDWGYDGP